MCPQQFWICQTIHSALEGREAVYLAFGLSIAPRQRDGIIYGIDVSAQHASEPHDRNELGVDHIVDLRIQWCGILASEDAVEAHRQVSHLDERIRSLLQDIGLLCLSLCQQASLLGAQCHGNQW